MTELQGRIHSFESCGSVDGPGLRFVVFMQGCSLRCKYCHNPDSWKFENGRLYTVDDVLHEALKYEVYMRFSQGGITLSGGEPLLQPEFAAELLRRCRLQGIHTAVDTSGAIPLEQAIPVYEQTNLVLLDIKCIDSQVYQQITDGRLENTLATAAYLGRQGIPIWLRHVLVPGLTDRDDLLERLAEYAATLPTLEQVELLPFHNIGEYKWHHLGYSYDLAGVEPPSHARIENARRIFADYGLKVVI